VPVMVPQQGQPQFIYPNGQPAGIPPPQFIFAAPEQQQFSQVVGYPTAPPSKEMESFVEEEQLQNIDFAATEYTTQQPIRMCSWLKRGWRLYRQDWMAYSIFQAVILLLLLAGYCGQYYFMLVQSPMWMIFVGLHLLVWPLHFGTYIAGSHIVRQADGTRGLNTSHFCQGFKLYFPLLFIIMILECIMSLGFLCFIIPGIYFAITLSFAPLVYIEFHHTTNPLHSVGIFGAIAHSHRCVRPHFWKVLGFMIICAGMNFAAMAFFFFGLVVTIPVSMLAVVFAFRDLFQLHPDKQPDASCYCC